MVPEQALIICASIHHRNTMKVAKVMREELDAVIVTPERIDEVIPDTYDLIGLGSGVYNGRHHQSIFDVLESVPFRPRQRVFIFSTAAVLSDHYHVSLKNTLIQKKYAVVGEFSCKGFMNHGFTKVLFGGINKDRPNEQDLQNARTFAKQLLHTENVFSSPRASTVQI